MERVVPRDEREAAYEAHAIYPKEDARGLRYTKGTAVGAPSVGWKGLDLVLRSDANAAAALPVRPLVVSRVLLALAVASGAATVAGFAASAHRGLDLSKLGGTGALFLAGGIGSLAFGVGAGVAFGRARHGYERSVDVYNDSLGLRLGIYDVDGRYRPAPGTLVDEEGYIITREVD